MEIYKILVIGNSFGEDATHFLHDLALTRGINTKVVNLYIGGCSLERHWRNIENEAKDYEYQLNGRATGNKVSIQDALAEEKWDYIVIQQSSHDSGWLDTYEPFMGWIAEYIKKEAPWAKFMLQETWAYEVDSKHDCFARYHRDQDEMYQKLYEAYHLAADRNHTLIADVGKKFYELSDKVNLYADDGCHPNEKGSQIAAEIIAEVLMN